MSHDQHDLVTSMFVDHSCPICDLQGKEPPLPKFPIVLEQAKADTLAVLRSVVLAFCCEGPGICRPTSPCMHHQALRALQVIDPKWVANLDPLLRTAIPE